MVWPEHRSWQQVWWTSRSGWLNLLQWIRAEQRFNHRIKGDQLAAGYSSNWRVRYNFMLQIPRKEKRSGRACRISGFRMKPSLIWENRSPIITSTRIGSSWAFLIRSANR
ncbi:DUF2490 domain-containing protein [Spirosoma utsteinense]|uniref:DUF2490 domain-containing protein n=1 Tax=Spirosoma utsteinense TaxID=2585773 RepID=UPI00293BAFE8|nr:DUF2490 domain-containing protein [Spirosoma utsteinense]